MGRFTLFLLLLLTGFTSGRRAFAQESLSPTLPIEAQEAPEDQVQVVKTFFLALNEGNNVLAWEQLSQSSKKAIIESASIWAPHLKQPQQLYTLFKQGSAQTNQYFWREFRQDIQSQYWAQLDFTLINESERHAELQIKAYPRPLLLKTIKKSSLVQVNPQTFKLIVIREAGHWRFDYQNTLLRTQNTPKD